MGPHCRRHRRHLTSCQHTTLRQHAWWIGWSGPCGALVAPVLALFPAFGPWIYAAAAIGYLAAMAAAFWIGRDALDAGSWADGIDGVRVILARIAS